MSTPVERLRKESLPPMKPRKASLDNPLDEELFEECRSGNCNLARIDGLLSHGANLESVSDEESLTPLLLALSTKNEELALALLARGARATRRSPTDKSNALLMAVRLGLKRVVKHMCSEMERDKVAFDARDHSGNGAAFIAIETNQMDIFEWLKEADALASLSKTNAFGFTPLARLARSNDARDRELMVRLLPHVDASQELEEGWNALTWACASKNDNVESVKLLVASGEFYNLLACDVKDNGLLHVCVKFDNPLTLTYLLSIDEGREFQVVLNIKNDVGDTPLMAACKLGRLECAKILLGAGARVNVFDVQHASPLIRAISKSHEAIVDLLLDVPGIELDFQDKSGNTALHYAAKQGHARFVSQLLEKGAAKILNGRGKYPSEVAKEYPDIEALFREPNAEQ